MRRAERRNACGPCEVAKRNSASRRGGTFCNGAERYGEDRTLYRSAPERLERSGTDRRGTDGDGMERLERKGPERIVEYRKGAAGTEGNGAVRNGRDVKGAERLERIGAKWTGTERIGTDGNGWRGLEGSGRDWK